MNISTILTILDNPKENSIPNSNKFSLSGKGSEFGNPDVDIIRTRIAKYIVVTDKRALMAKNNLLFLYSS